MEVWIFFSLFRFPCWSSQRENFSYAFCNSITIAPDAVIQYVTFYAKVFGGHINDNITILKIVHNLSGHSRIFYCFVSTKSAVPLFRKIKHLVKVHTPYVLWYFLCAIEIIGDISYIIIVCIQVAKSSPSGCGAGFKLIDLITKPLCKYLATICRKVIIW